MEPGTVLFDRYRVVRRIAAGGMGTVFEARDVVLDQPVALKRVRYASLPESDADETRRRTLREARNAARLRGDPHVVAIYDVQIADGDVWLVLEYLPSRSLAEVTAGNVRLDPRTAAGIGAAVARGLAAAHAVGITHRDVKPGNVLIPTDVRRTAKLTDFGISLAEGDPTLTATGQVSGTPAYMAREVARGEDATPASDVFSLAATLYAAVEGTGPFGPQSNPRAMVYRVAHDPVRPPEQAGPLAPVLMAMLSDPPSRRPDAATVAGWLEAVAGGVGAVPGLPSVGASPHGSASLGSGQSGPRSDPPGPESPGAGSPGPVSPGPVSPGVVSPGRVSPAASPGPVSPGAGSWAPRSLASVPAASGYAERPASSSPTGAEPSAVGAPSRSAGGGGAPDGGRGPAAGSAAGPAPGAGPAPAPDRRDPYAGPPRTSAPGPYGTRAAEPPAEEATRSRRRPGLVVGGVVLAAVLLAGVVGGAWALLSSPEDPAAAPSPRAVSGDPRQADPCPLLDDPVLRSFGAPTPSVASVPSGCRVDVVPPGGREVRASAYFTSRADLAGTRRPVDDMTEVRGTQTAAGPDGRGCEHGVDLPDGNEVVLEVQSFDAGVAPCAVADGLLDAATARLARDGVTYDPARTGAGVLTGADACQALDPAAIARAGVGVQAFPGYAGWSCSWGSAQSYATVQFGAARLAAGVVGTPVAPIDGRAAFSRPQGGGCAVEVLRRAAPGADRAETVTTAVQLAGASGEQMCAAATDLAVTAQRRLPTD